MSINHFQDAFVALEITEKALNVLGYMPVVGTFTSYIRGGLAKIEAITGIGLAIIGLIGTSSASNVYLSISVTLIGHAMLNGLRTAFEYKTLLPLVTTLPYDIISHLILGRRLFTYLK
jgi:hypothetical protein